MIRHLPYDAVVDLCRALDCDPENVREIRLRAPRTCEVWLYQLKDGEKFVADLAADDPSRAVAVAVSHYTLSVEREEEREVRLAVAPEPDSVN